MPPKGKESGKFKGKGKQPLVARRKSPRKKAASTEEPPMCSTDEENNSGAESETATKSQTQNSKRRRKEVEFPIETMKKIAAFFEGNPMFYDVSHESHKNNHLKDTKMLELSAEINVPGLILFLLTNLICLQN